MTLAIPPPPLHTLAIAGCDDRFPVYRVFCVGRNYAAHAREMGKDPTREPPFFFMKPAAAVVDAQHPITVPYPPKTTNYHHEIELVVAIGAACRDATPQSALGCVLGYGVGLDMTRRDLQLEARDKGRPWEFGKSFAGSAPIGPIHLASAVGHLQSGAITIAVGGQMRQSSDLALMIWSVAECIVHLSAFDALQPGDLIMTGTPEGVGAVVAGDSMRGAIAGLGEIVVSVGAR
jgi:fumarylpyruvate hydrolase